PLIRANGISPGAILWPEQPLTQGHKASIMNQIALKRLGTAQDIAATVVFLANAPYITGQTITVDGGRSLLGRILHSGTWKCLHFNKLKWRRSFTCLNVEVPETSHLHMEVLIRAMHGAIADGLEFQDDR
ncbi:MAG: SDR family oxidoreductase, partial [Algicola sp.]|nr:SDR family oxidoreductase [Algicola sp.]